MDHFAGLDVSVKETTVCILDDAGIVSDIGAFAAARRSLEDRARVTKNVFPRKKGG